MELSAKQRKILGKKNKNLRKNGLMPAVLYSSDSSVGNKEVLNLTLETIEFNKVYKEVGTSALVKVNLENRPQANVLISQVQTDPITLEPIHASLFEVNMAEEVETEIPVVLVNDEEHEMVKSGEGIIILLLSDIRVKCLPANIPQQFTVDALKLKELGDVFTAEDLKVDPSKIELLVESEEAIAKLDYAQQQETEEEGPRSVDDVEVTTGAKENDKEEKDNTAQEDNKSEE